MNVDDIRDSSVPGAECAEQWVAWKTFIRRARLPQQTVPLLKLNRNRDRIIRRAVSRHTNRPNQRLIHTDICLFSLVGGDNRAAHSHAHTDEQTIHTDLTGNKKDNQSGIASRNNTHAHRHNSGYCVCASTIGTSERAKKKFPFASAVVAHTVHSAKAKRCTAARQGRISRAHVPGCMHASSRRCGI